jgi:hypothetical protein
VLRPAMRRPITSLAIATVLALSSFACWGGASDPRVRPVKMGDVDTGATSMEAVRRQLQGTWELASLEVLSGGSMVPVPSAKGQLTYDEFGNLQMRGTVNDPKIDSGVLQLSGRAVIDPAKHMLRLMDVKGTTTTAEQALDSTVDPAKVRYYEFVNDLLKTTVKDASGATTATATWKRVS